MNEQLGQSNCQDRSIRIGLFGSLCNFTRVALESLIAEDITPSYLILHGYGAACNSHGLPAGDLLAPAQPEILRLCDKHRIVTHFVQSDADSLADFAICRPSDCMLLACFPSALPMSIAERAGSGCFNIHPSLLPRYRGPNPLFWQLRLGERHTGVTVHRVSAQLDCGDIVFAKQLQWKSGLRIGQIERILVSGAVQAFRQLLGQEHPKRWSLIKQDSNRATFHPHPRDSDYAVSCNEHAQTVYQFVRAYGGAHFPLSVLTNANQVAIKDAVSWRSGVNGADSMLAGGDAMTVEFTDGLVGFEVANAGRIS